VILDARYRFSVAPEERNVYRNPRARRSSSSGATHSGMANTYSQIYVQVVFAVEARQAIIREQRREELQRYITGIVTNKNQKLLAI
jgi:hypothetical protein